MNNIFLISLII